MTDETKTAVEAEKNATESKSVEEQTEILARDVKWRAKYTEKAQEAEKVKAQAEAEKKELQSQVEKTSKAHQDMQKRVIEIELKAQAMSAGLKDLDFLKMIDTSQLKMNDDGSVQGLEKAINDFKASKPQLFGADKKTSSSKNESMPASEKKSSNIDALKMSDEDWRNNRHRFMAGDFSM